MLYGAWIRFKKNYTGFFSFIILSAIIIFILPAEFIANDKPIVVKYNGSYYFPIFNDYYPNSLFGLEGNISVDWLDDNTVKSIQKNGFLVFPLIKYSYNTLYTDNTSPSPPSSKHLLGTDTIGRDVLANIIYGIRISIIFALSLTFVASIIGIYVGSLMGYNAGILDFIGGRVLEVWKSTPILYVLIIFAAFITPSIFTLFFILLIFEWTALVGIVRAEMLRSKNLLSVEAAKSIGVSKTKIIYAYILPNVFTSTISTLPFLISANMVALTTLDYLGLGLPPSYPSIGGLLNIGANNLYAPWIVISTIIVFSLILVLLLFIGDSLRNAIDTKE